MLSAVTLWKQATPDYYRSVGNQFGAGKSTVGTVLMEVCKSINAVMSPSSVRIRNILELSVGREQMGFLSCTCAILDTHISCVPPFQMRVLTGKDTTASLCRPLGITAAF